MRLVESPMEQVEFRGRPYFVKRDDRLHPFPGNKARKLRGLLALDWTKIGRVVSHGGNQSNAMLALARLAHFQGRPFDYHIPPLPASLRTAPIGNLGLALELGMNLIETRRPPKRESCPTGTLFVPQGAAMAEAEIGLRELARELNRFARNQELRRPILFVPSGTGTTAVYLHRHLSFPVLTTPCVGDRDYLRRQFAELTSPPYPAIIGDEAKARFGRLEEGYLRLWSALRRETGIEFDLLYDPPGWRALTRLDHDGDIIYLHCGGQEGNASMLARYRRRFGEEVVDSLGP